MKNVSRNKRTLIIVALCAVVFLAIGGKIFLDAIYVPAILMYHSVDRGGLELKHYGGKLNVYPETFDRQMRFLRDHGYKVIPLEKMIELIKEGKRVPRKTVSITFDDGLENNFTHAYPVLKKYGFPATIFVPTDFVGKEGYLNWDQIRLMSGDNISFGSHTMSQCWLPDLDTGELWRELAGSKRILEEKTGRGVKTLSYHMGGYNEKIKRVAEKAGYAGAVATNPGRGQPADDPYALKRLRISMSSASPVVFWIQTSGYYTFIKEIRDED